MTSKITSLNMGCFQDGYVKLEVIKLYFEDKVIRMMQK